MSRRYAAAPGGCTYLVAYHGHAQDHDAWLGHYLDRHVPLMLRLPGLRALEVCTRLDWRGGLRWPREDAVQRNKVVFDDAFALDAALRSDVRMEMRRDFEASPIFHGGNVHYPMTTRSAPMHASSASLPLRSVHDPDPDPRPGRARMRALPCCPTPCAARIHLLACSRPTLMAA